MKQNNKSETDETPAMPGQGTDATIRSGAKHLSEFDRAALKQSRDHLQWEKEEDTFPTPPMLLHETAKLSDIAMKQAFGEADRFRHSRRSILLYLRRHDGVPQQELVAFSHLTPATVSVELTEMEREGLVERRRDEKDLRATRVYITQKGQEWNARICAILQERDRQMMAGFSEEESRLLRQFLFRIRDNLLHTIED